MKGKQIWIEYCFTVDIYRYTFQINGYLITTGRLWQGKLEYGGYSATHSSYISNFRIEEL